MGCFSKGIDETNIFCDEAIMTLVDSIVALAILGLGWLLWHQKETSNWREWLIKYLLISSLLFGPYFFLDDIKSYWRSSPEGPINIEPGWW